MYNHSKLTGLLIVISTIVVLIAPTILFPGGSDASSDKSFTVDDKYGHPVIYRITSSDEVRYSGFDTHNVIKNGWIIYIPAYVNDPSSGKAYKVTSAGINSNYSQISVDPYNPYFKTEYDGKVLLSNDGTVLIGMCHNGWSSSVTEFIIPSTVKTVQKLSLTTKMKTLIIPDSVETLGEHCGWCSYDLETIYMGDGVKTIGDGAFGASYKLKNVYFGKNVETIGHDAFYNCTSLNHITIPKSVKSIEYRAFQDCTSLSDVTIEGNPYISNSAFENTPCGIKGQPDEIGEKNKQSNILTILAIIAIIAIIVIIILLKKRGLIGK